jgi:hypothetical protein
MSADDQLLAAIFGGSTTVGLSLRSTKRIQTMNNKEPRTKERDWNSEEKAVLLLLYFMLFAQGITTVSLGFICCSTSVLMTIFAFHLGQEYNN